MLKINSEICSQCGQCQESCPTGAIDVDDEGLFYIDASICSDCEACINDCPFEAIEFIDADSQSE